MAALVLVGRFVATETAQDNILPRSVLEKVALQDPSHVDLAVKIDLSVLGGPGRELLGGIAMGRTIALETFVTQFVLDLEAALSVPAWRMQILNVSQGDVHFSWRWSSTIVSFRVANSSEPPSVANAVRDLTQQAQQPRSRLFAGNLTRALDEHWGVVALDWDASLRLAFAIEVVGKERVAPGRSQQTINLGASRWCEEEVFESAYCEWERYFEEDLARALEIARSRVEVLVVRPAAPDAVLTHFRIFPSEEMNQAAQSTAISIGRLLAQVQNSSSALYAGNVTVRTDSAWGVSGVNAARRRTVNPYMPYASRSNTSLPFVGYASHILSPDYERCKATQRCARGNIHYDQANASIYYTTQAFAGGAHVMANLFASFEDWRPGTFGWRPLQQESAASGLTNWSVFTPNGVDNHSITIRGAHIKPFAFSRLGPHIRTINTFGWCHERQPCQPAWNGGLVLNVQRQASDIELQQALVDNVADDLEWILEHEETALLDADGARARFDSAGLMRKRAHDVQAKLRRESQVLEDLSTSQCAGLNMCELLFNTSSLQLRGAINATGEIAVSGVGYEVAVFAFDSVSLGPEVNVTLVGQRALVLASRSSVLLNTSFAVTPGTLGGLPGGFSIARRPEDTLSDDPKDLPVDDPESYSFVSNNVNGPGSPSTRVHLRTVTTSAANIDEIQLVSVKADDGETLNGYFYLEFGTFRSRALSPFASAHTVQEAIDQDLNRRNFTQSLVDSVHAGVGHVLVTRGRANMRPSVEDEENAWLVTFITAAGEVPMLRIVDDFLGGVGAHASVERVTRGVSIGGFFALKWADIATTRPLRYDVSAAEMATAIVSDFPGVRSAAVSRSNSGRGRDCDDGLCHSGPSPGGGLTWALTITTLDDNRTPVAPTDPLSREASPPQQLLALADNLTGVNATATVELGFGGVHREHLAQLKAASPDCVASFSLAFGGAGAGHGGQGGGPSSMGFYDGAGDVARRDDIVDKQANAQPFGTAGGSSGSSYGDAGIRELLGGSGGAIGYSHPFVASTLAVGGAMPGRGGAGGGAIEIVAINDIRLGDEARVTVNGEHGHSGHLGGGGGGSGGSILLAAGGVIGFSSFAKVEARGGDGGPAASAPGGGGGGGRIAVYGAAFADDKTPHYDVSGGRCHGGMQVEEMNDRDGQNGSIAITVTTTDFAYDATYKGAFGTRGALKVKGRTAPFRGGPEYRFAESPEQPARVSFYIRLDNTRHHSHPQPRHGSWGAAVFLFQRSSSSHSVGLGVIMSDKIAHGSGFHVSPDDNFRSIFVDGNIAMSVARFASWHKFDISINWSELKYDLFIDDVLRVENAPLDPLSSTRGFDTIGTYLLVSGDDASVGEALFDEIYVGPDHSLGFRCPRSTRSGVDFDVRRPERAAWPLEELGGESTTATMSRHDNHVSERELYAYANGGLEPFDGWGHVDFRSDVKQRYTTGDLPRKPASFNAGGLLSLQGDYRGPSRRVAGLATPTNDPEVAWEVRHLDLEWDGPSRHDTAFDARDHPHEGAPTLLWFGEHELPNNETSPLGGGGVCACSTDDLVHWKREGIALHFANLSDMVHARDTWLPGCDGYATARGTQAGYGCSGSAGLVATRPRVLIAPPDAKNQHGFVMWFGVDDTNESLALAGVATAAHAGGPYTFRRSFYPDGNETRDQAVWHAPKGGAFLGRTYFTDIEYVMPSPQMQPVWEMVLNATGQFDFGLSYHRAFYHRDYDDYHDIYLQRWRLEDRPWLVLCVNRVDHLDNFSVPRGVSFGEDGAACPDPFFYKLILGQGYDVDREVALGIESRFKDPMEPNNSVWRPDSVPAVKAQPWQYNYIDGSCGIRQFHQNLDVNDPDLPYRQHYDCSNHSNIADNPPHGTKPDDLVGDLQIVETRRAKFIAVSILTSDLLDTNSALRVYEGELENGLEVDALFQHSPFDFAFENDARISTFEPPVIIGDAFPNVVPVQESVVRYHQYIDRFNDRAAYSLNCVYDGTCPVNFKDQTRPPSERGKHYGF